MADRENMSGDLSNTEEEKNIQPTPPKFQKNSPGLEHLAEENKVGKVPPTQEGFEKGLTEGMEHLAGKIGVEGQELRDVLEPWDPNHQTESVEPLTGHKVDIPKEAVVNMMGGWPGSGPFRPEVAIDEIKAATDYLITTEEARLPNLISLAATTLESEFRINQWSFLNLMTIKASLGLDTERGEIEKIYKEFATRWWIRAAELATNFGNKDRFMEIIPTAFFKEAFEYAWEIPGVETGAKWVEDTQGLCFRNYLSGTDEIDFNNKPTDIIIISRISTELQLNSGLMASEADLAAALVYRLYVVTGEITRFVGPLSHTGSGKLAEEEFREQAFHSSQINWNNLDESSNYWNGWLDQWANSDYNFLNLETGFKSQLSGNCPFLWQRTIFTPEYLATHQDKATFRARGLIRTFDTHVRPMSMFYGKRNLLEFHGSDKDPANFFLWAAMVTSTSDFVDNKTVPFLKMPFGSAAGIFDEPQAKMGEVMKQFNDLSPSLNFLNRLNATEPSYARAYLLTELLRYANTDEGQRILGLRNESLRSNLPWGGPQFRWAIFSAQAGIEREQVEKLYRQFHASAAANFATGLWISFVKSLPGGQAALAFYNRVLKRFIIQ